MPSALIIGGGPAGSTAAICLARSGWQITLIEQHRFPRDKVCGECLSSLGIDVLHRLGQVASLSALKPARLTRVAAHPPHGPAATLALPRPMWGISRRAMDDALLAAAREAGVRVLQPARCERIEPGDPPSATARHLIGNRIITLRADYLLLADGKGVLPGFRPALTGEFGVQAHLQLEGPADTIELFGLNGHYGGIAPIENGTWNLAFTLPAARLSAVHGDFDRLLESMAAGNSMLARRLRGAQLVRPWLATPLPRFDVNSSWPRNIIPIGNAAAAIEPIGGEGMGLAVRSAELAAWALDAAERRLDRSLLDQLPQVFRRLWRRRALACRLAGLAASSPTIAEAVATLLAHNHPLQRAVMSLAGKRDEVAQV
jgi:menaquinone-9 beta-reductase